MELLSYNNLWYGIPLYVEYEEEYYDDEDSGTTAFRPARRSKRNSPVCRGSIPSIPRNKETSRRKTSKGRRAKTLRLYA